MPSPLNSPSPVNELQRFEAALAKCCEWVLHYRRHISELPVKPDVEPGFLQIHELLPENPVPFNETMQTFCDAILPGMTHWQHPGFMAYFPAPTSYPSQLAEMLTAAMGAQCISWITSPAATELEIMVLQQLAVAFGLDRGFKGVIQNSASDATLAALITAREHVVVDPVIPDIRYCTSC